MKLAVDLDVTPETIELMEQLKGKIGGDDNLLLRCGICLLELAVQAEEAGRPFVLADGREILILGELPDNVLRFIPR